ncbi:hypothetical protein BDV96DRAFT_655459 [Lophiotrema nucula]|uniref:Uncharacterized protein n=1 Tax=Lophiotrema nucula TaxID=690887 RepID=A0A6A5YE87_9PLEO|nr:hypothetical protein BDV96DRAFT_655459 [Lophiotrema nucula]
MEPQTFLDMGRYSRSYTKTNRRTVWLTASPNGDDIQLSAPWPVRYGSFRQQNKRWTGAFDNDARASRMSFLVDGTLLPRAPHTRVEHQQWIGRVQRRATWLNQLQAKDSKERVWSGEFDIERRPS